WPEARTLLVVCGPGNNGGDGYVLARLARAARLRVTTTTICDPARLRGDAQRAYEDFIKSGGAAAPWDAGLLESADVVVDAMFGTGLSRALDENLRSVIDTINRSGRPTLALDIP